MDINETFSPLVQLLDILNLQDSPTLSNTHQYTANNLNQPMGRVYGGQVLAQGLLAAGKTVPQERLPHSLHGYFIRPAKVEIPLFFDVELLNDGRSFSTRRTHVFQEDQVILTMVSSFQEPQRGIEHGARMPSVPRPEELPSAVDILGSINVPMAQFWSNDSPIEVKHVDPALYLQADEELHATQSVWLRTKGQVPENELLHRALLAFACDQIILEPVLRGHGLSWSKPGLSLASLDHCIWWHRPVRADEWLLYVQQSPSATGGRGLGLAYVFSEAGEHVATVGQEGMIRIPEIV